MALVFNGNSFVTILNNPLLQITGDQTIEMWIKVPNFDERRNPWNKAYGGEGTMTIEIDGTINFFWGTSGENNQPYDATRSVALLLGDWIHIAIVRDISGEGLLTWYFNGSPVSTRTTVYLAATASIFSLILGDGYTNPFQGSMYEVRLWNVARTGFDISSNFGKSINPQSGLVGYWKMDQAEGTYLLDSSGNTFTGEIVLPEWDNDFPFVEPVPVPTFTELNLSRTIFHLGYSALEWSNNVVSQALDRAFEQGLDSQITSVLDNLDELFQTKQTYLVNRAGIQVEGATANSYREGRAFSELDRGYAQYQKLLGQLLSLSVQSGTARNQLFYG